MITIPLFFIVPCLVVADVQCPDNRVSCPEDKRCCQLGGRYTCCDSDDIHVPEIKMKVRVGMDFMDTFPHPNMSEAAIQAGPLDTCSSENCHGECCSSKACCPYIASDCCSETTCCPSLHICCPGERCCPFDKKCCGELCCGAFDECCPGHCCRFLDKCCGNGCCPSGTQCCGDWCCLQVQKCGKSKDECHDAGHINAPCLLGMLLLIGFLFVSRRL